MAWEDPTLDTDEDSVIGGILEGMADRLDGWEPVEGAPEVALAEEIGREIAATNALTVEVMQLALAGIGETVFGLSPRIGAAATLEVTLIFQTPDLPGSNANGSFPATAQYVVDLPAGFTVVAGDIAFVNPAGRALTLTLDYFDTSYLLIGQGNVYRHVYGANIPIDGFVAQTEGTVGNVAPNLPVTVITSHAMIRGARPVATMGASGAAGGVDGETLLTYLDRLTVYLQTLRPGGVRADDLAAFSRTVSGVDRAIGFDLYDPVIPGPHQRTATIVAITGTGLPVSGATRTQLQAQLDATREVNFRVILGDPTYTAIAVVVNATHGIGADPDVVRAAVSAAVAALINPASWGSTPARPDDWTERKTLSVLDVAAVVGQVAGVATLVSITINGSTNTLTLPGPAALPTPLNAQTNPSTITVNIT